MVPAGMQDFADLRECCKEDRRDFDAPEIPRNKNEHPGFAGPQSGDFQRAVPQPLILSTRIRNYGDVFRSSCGS
jgi:hypothetical protein